MATINEALKSLILALGGDPESMYDNTTISDYIKDLETAMQASGSGAKIDDTTASDSTVYSSAKTESLIPADELPAVTAADIGKILTVVSDGEGGATWAESTPESNVFVVTGTLTQEGGFQRFTYDNGITDGDIAQAYADGKEIFLEDPSSYTFHFEKKYISDLVFLHLETTFDGTTNSLFVYKASVSNDTSSTKTYCSVTGTQIKSAT